MLEGEAATASISEWELNSDQYLHLSIKVISKRSQSVVDRVEERMEAIRQEMIRERPELADSMYLADDGTWRSGPVSLPLSSVYQFELKVEMDRFVITHLDSVTPPPPVPPRPEDWPEEKPWPPPRPPEPKQKWDIAAGIIGGAFWEIQTASHFIMFNTNLFEVINREKRKELLAVGNEPISRIYWARKSKNLGFPLLPGKMNWDKDSFKGVNLYDGAFQGKVRRSADGRVISAYYDSGNGSPGKGFTHRILLEYTYPEDDPQTWVPKSFTRAC